MGSKNPKKEPTNPETCPECRKIMIGYDAEAGIKGCRRGMTVGQANLVEYDCEGRVRKTSFESGPKEGEAEKGKGPEAK